MGFVKKTAAVLAAVALLLTGTASIYAQTPANLMVLGDSIATGYGLEGYTAGKNDSAAGSFANMLYADMKKGGCKTYNNYAVDGMTAQALVEHLGSVASPEIINEEGSRNVIVLSIGGNDLLNPLYGAIGKAIESQKSTLELMGVTVDTSTPEATMATLNSAVAADKTGTVLSALQVLAATPENWANVVAATGTFDTDFDSIAKALYANDPNAEIYVLTVYNPFESVPGLEMLSAASDSVITSLNAVITKRAAEYNAAGKRMTVVDVNSAFKGKAPLLTNMSRLDIHPNAAGHQLISQLLIASVGGTPVPVTGRNETLPMVVLVVSLGTALLARPKKMTAKAQ